MRALKAIYLREMAAYLRSPIAYALWAGFLALTGYFFYSGVIYYALASMQAMNSALGGVTLNVQDMLVAPLLGNMSVLLLLITPLLTMRLLSEEKRSGTLELLLSYPLGDPSVVLAKFLAALSTLALILAPTLAHMALLAWLGPLHWPAVLLGYLGLLLLGGAFIALGLVASALTENQIVAAIVAFAGLLILWMLRWAGALSQGDSWLSGLQQLSLAVHFENMAKGLLDTADLAYFLLFIGFFLFVAIRALEAKRWKA